MDVHEKDADSAVKGAWVALRPELVVYRAEHSRRSELFDLPDLAIVPAETPAPVRFLPEFDNLVLAGTFLLVLILRPRGLSRGRELAWPADWQRPRFGGLRRGRLAPLAGDAPAAATDPLVEQPIRSAE